MCIGGAQKGAAMTTAMQQVRYKCCAHCKFPCPLEGHTSKCSECRTSANGRRVKKPPHLQVVR